MPVLIHVGLLCCTPLIKLYKHGKSFNLVPAVERNDSLHSFEAEIANATSNSKMTNNISINENSSSIIYW